MWRFFPEIKLVSFPSSFFRDKKRERRRRRRRRRKAKGEEEDDEEEQGEEERKEFHAKKFLSCITHTFTPVCSLLPMLCLPFSPTRSLHSRWRPCKVCHYKADPGSEPITRSWDRQVRMQSDVIVCGPRGMGERMRDNNVGLYLRRFDACCTVGQNFSK